MQLLSLSVFVEGVRRTCTLNTNQASEAVVERKDIAGAYRQAHHDVSGVEKIRLNSVACA